MLIFSYNFEKYIKNKVLPLLLIDSRPSKYCIKGSFRRRITYITDIDVINDVYPEISKSNIYEKVINKIKTIQKHDSIILYALTCGTDNRFRITDGNDEELSKIKKLLDEKEQAQLDIIVNKYADNINKRIFFINELIWEKYRLRWTPDEVLANSKILVDNQKVTFTECVDKSSMILFQYFLKLDEYPIGIDMVINYEPVENVTAVYENASAYLTKVANYSKEYYYMLFPFRHYFRNNKEIRAELEEIIEKKYGLYKQLMVRIDTYHTLYDNKLLDISLATQIISSIVRDTKKLPIFSSNTITKIKESSNNQSSVKMSNWYVLLNVLYDEINTDVNMRAEKYFYKFLGLLPENEKDKYYIKNDYRKYIPVRYSVN